MPTLALRNLTLSIGGNHLLRDVSLSFDQGRVIGIIGPNGAGKTSLLKAIAGMLPLEEGEIFLGNTCLDTLTRKERSCTISYVPQQTVPAFSFTVEQIVAMGLYARFGRAQVSSDVGEALELVDALPLRHRAMGALSSGERQRIYIARAIAADAPLLLLDEPTSNLDIGHQRSIWQLLHREAAAGKTVLVTVHDLEAARRFCDEIALLDKGRALGQGSFDEILTEERLLQVYGVPTPTG